MSGHYLHINSISEGGNINWRWECRHAADDPKWVVRMEDNTIDPNCLGECYLESWWSAVGEELINDHGHPITTLPIPVEPDDEWTYADGGGLDIVEVSAP